MSEVDEAPIPEVSSASHSEKSIQSVSEVDETSIPEVSSASTSQKSAMNKSDFHGSPIPVLNPNDVSLSFDEEVLALQEQRSVSIDIRDDRLHQTEVKIGPVNNEVLDKRGRRQVLPDPSLTVALGGYSFEAYSDPVRFDHG